MPQQAQQLCSFLGKKQSRDHPVHHTVHCVGPYSSRRESRSADTCCSNDNGRYKRHRQVTVHMASTEKRQTKTTTQFHARCTQQQTPTKSRLVLCSFSAGRQERLRTTACAAALSLFQQCTQHSQGMHDQYNTTRRQRWRPITTTTTPRPCVDTACFAAFSVPLHIVVLVGW